MVVEPRMLYVFFDLIHLITWPDISLLSLVIFWKSGKKTKIKAKSKDNFTRSSFYF